jgi:hypothetical protein
MRQISTAWLLLLLLSAGSTLLSLDIVAAPAAGLALLGLAWTKARIILYDYLGLRSALFWRRGFGLVLALYVSGLAVLYAIA